MKKNILDNKTEILKLDSKNMLGSIELLGEQVSEVWKAAKQIKMPADYKKIANVVVVGMGGSTLGAHLIKELYKDNLKVPIDIVNHYKVPVSVDGKTLVIASSYSGTTEEAISAARDARAKKAKIAAICSGGTLAQWAKMNGIPALVFPTEFNPCGSPRMGLGYSIFGQLAILTRAGLLKISESEIAEALKTILKFQRQFGVDSREEANTAKKFARGLLGRSVWYVASEHLSGNAHIAANQMNENAKRFAGHFIIPELNHHLMEGMLFPKTNKENIRFVLIESELYDTRVQKRYAITREVLDKNGIGWLAYKCVEKSALAQVCEVLMLGSYISYYSAILQGIDPTAIPFVDFFKAQLKK